MTTPRQRFARWFFFGGPGEPLPDVLTRIHEAMIADGQSHLIAAYMAERGRVAWLAANRRLQRQRKRERRTMTTDPTQDITRHPDFTETRARALGWNPEGGPTWQDYMRQHLSTGGSESGMRGSKPGKTGGTPQSGIAHSETGQSEIATASASDDPPAHGMSGGKSRLPG